MSLLFFSFAFSLCFAEHIQCPFSHLNTLSSLNGKSQETEMYPNDNNHLFIRRTRSFQLSLKTNCTLPELNFGLFDLDSPSELGIWSTGTGDWTLKELDRNGTRGSTFAFAYPAEGWLGRFRIGMWAKADQLKAIHFLPLSLYVLVDPLSKYSAAYMSDEKRRQEFAFSETGLIWIGEVQSPYAIYWDYSPFSWSAIRVAYEILSNVSLHLRGDLVAVSRHFATSLASNNGKGGILYGKWGSEYPGEDINFPWEWSGSEAILAKYIRTKEAVRYGQCWTFAALLTTLLRAIGIPARPVTNFKSGSHVPSSGYIDEYYQVGENGRKIRYNSTGKAWNFHVWTEAWVSRVDIKTNEPDYSPLAGTFGWQAIDSTFKLGPASVESIKNATSLPVELPFPEPYDLWSLTQAVNATVRRWVKHANESEYHMVRDYDNLIGRKILTKHPLEKKVDDITNDYEDSKQNKRWDAERARDLARECGFSWTIDFTDLVKVKAKLGEANEEENDGVGVPVGSNITATLQFKLHTQPALTLHVALAGFFSDYTDTFITPSTDQFTFDVELTELHKIETKTIVIPPTDYIPLLRRGSHYFVMQGVASQANNQSLSIPRERGVPIIFDSPNLKLLNVQPLLPLSTSVAFSKPQDFDSKSAQFDTEIPSSISAAFFRHESLLGIGDSGLLVNAEVSYHNSLPIPLNNLRLLAEIRVPYAPNSCNLQGRTVKSLAFTGLLPNQLSIAPLWIYLRFFNLSNISACANTTLQLQVALSFVSNQTFSFSRFLLPLQLPSFTSYPSDYWIPLETHAIKRRIETGPAGVIAIVAVGFLLAFLSLCSLYCSQRGHPPPIYDPYNYRFRRPYNHYTVYPSSRLPIQSPRPTGWGRAVFKSRCYYLLRCFLLSLKSIMSCLCGYLHWLYGRLYGLCYSVRIMMFPLFSGCCEHPYSPIPSPNHHEV